MNETKLNFEVTRINNKLKTLEEEIACFGKKSDIDEYFALLDDKIAITKNINN